MNEENIFTKIIRREIPTEIIYEDDDFMAILDILPVNPGHILLMPKHSYKNIFDMPEDILKKVGPLLKTMALAQKEALEADGVNIGLNNEKAAGQVIFHAHFRIMPRFEGDGYKLWEGRKYKTGEMKKTAEKIRAALSK